MWEMISIFYCWKLDVDEMEKKAHISRQARISSYTLQIGNFSDHKQMITSPVTMEKIC